MQVYNVAEQNNSSSYRVNEDSIWEGYIQQALSISKSLFDAIQGRGVGRKHVDRDPAAHDMITITRASRGARVTRACEYESENFADVAEDRRLRGRRCRG